MCKKIIRKGFTAAMDGNKLLVTTSTDNMVEFKVDNGTRMPWDWYCKLVKITIEIISEEEYDKIETIEPAIIPLEDN